MLYTLYSVCYIQLWLSEIQAFPGFSFYWRKSVTLYRRQRITCFKANIQLCDTTLNFFALILRLVITLLFCVTELWIRICLWVGATISYLSAPEIFSVQSRDKEVCNTEHFKNIYVQLFVTAVLETSRDADCQKKKRYSWSKISGSNFVSTCRKRMCHKVFFLRLKYAFQKDISFFQIPLSKLE